MKRTLKAAVAIMTAMMINCMSVAMPAKAAAANIDGEQTITKYQLVTELVPGKEYLIVSKPIDETNAMAMAASTNSNCISTASVNVVVEDNNSFVIDEISSALVWTAVESPRGNAAEVYLKSNLTGRYLGTFTGFYTWSSMYAAESMSYTRSGITLSAYGHSGNRINFDGTNFVISDSPVNYAYFYEKITSER